MIRLRVPPVLRLGRAKIRVVWRSMASGSAEWVGTDRRTFYLNPMQHGSDVEKLDSLIHEIVHRIEEKSGHEAVDRAIVEEREHSAVFRIIEPLAEFLIRNKDDLFYCSECRKKGQIPRSKGPRRRDRTSPGPVEGVRIRRKS